MAFEWDENKNKENLLKHGFDFVDAGQLFGNPMLVVPDIRKEYGENRWIGIGMMNNGIIAVIVFTEKESETIRIISMRKASKKERKKYEENIQNRLGQN
jgi:uncharacterized DUF497 family protein